MNEERQVLQAIRANPTWAWVLSGLLTAIGVLLAHALSGAFFVVSETEELPIRRTVASESGPLPEWRPRPSIVKDGWLVEPQENGKRVFDVRNCTVSAVQILDMPPGPDDIPAITQPTYEVASGVAWVAPEDEVLAVSAGVIRRCYPLAILRWHNVVNDVVNLQPVAILFDPLSGLAMRFSRKLGGRVLTFGISGRAYNGCALLYDRETHSLWYPLRGECIAGPLAGKAVLVPLPLRRTTWLAWSRQNPQGQVLSRNTGFGRPYELDPYARAPIGPGGEPVDYWASPSLVLAPLTQPLAARGIVPKALVLGVCDGDRAYAFVPPRDTRGPVHFIHAYKSRELSVRFDARPAFRVFVATDAAGREPWQVTCFWFAWQAAYPRTEVVRLPGG